MGQIPTVDEILKMMDEQSSTKTAEDKMVEALTGDSVSEKAEEAKPAEEEKKAEEAKPAEEEKKAEEAKPAEEEKKAEEAKPAEEAEEGEEKKAELEKIAKHYDAVGRIMARALVDEVQKELDKRASAQEPVNEEKKAEEAKPAEEEKKAEEAKPAEEEKKAEATSVADELFKIYFSEEE